MVFILSSQKDCGSKFRN